jgi:hypothetical protein
VLTNTLTGALTLAIPSSANDTQVVFSLPILESGPYSVKVRVDPLG